MPHLRLPRTFSGAGPKQEAPAERISGDGEHPPREKRSGGAFAWLLKHRLVWLAVVAFTLAGLLLTPVASFVVTQSGGGSAVNAALAFLVVSLLWLMMRHSQIIDRQRQEFLHRAQRLEKSHDAIAHVLSTTVDLRDAATAEHSDRVSELTAVLARQLGLGKQERRDIRLAATLHDIGRLVVAEAVLSKSGPLGDEEWAEMREHPRIGYETLKGIHFLAGAAEIIYAHHERYDGTGYPRGLVGEDIPLAARTFAVVDAYDAITSHRPYRKARSHEEAVQDIRHHAGTQFDPEVVRAFLEANKQRLIRPDNGERLETDSLQDVLSGD